MIRGVRRLATLILIVMFPSIGGSIEADDIQFPYSLSLRPNHRLIVYGQELTGQLVFNRGNDETFVNGLKVFPPPPQLETPRNEEQLTLFYGNIPYVQRRTLELGSFAEAVAEFDDRWKAMVDTVGATWRNYRAELLERDDLPRDSVLTIYGAIAARALLRLDPDVVGHLTEARRHSSISSTGFFRYLIPGWPGPVPVAMLGTAPPQGTPDLRSEEVVRRRLRTLRGHFSKRNDTLVIISRTSERVAHGASARELLEEISLLRRNPMFVPRRLTEDEAHEILNPGWE